MPILEEVRTVTADGRLVVPWVIQRALGLEHGGPVRFRVENGVVTLRRGGSARRPDAEDGAEPRTATSARRWRRNLKTLLDVADRDRASRSREPSKLHSGPGSPTTEGLAHASHQRYPGDLALRRRSDRARSRSTAICSASSCSSPNTAWPLWACPAARFCCCSSAAPPRSPRLGLAAASSRRITARGTCICASPSRSANWRHGKRICATRHRSGKPAALGARRNESVFSRSGGELDRGRDAGVMAERVTAHACPHLPAHGGNAIPRSGSICIGTDPHASSSHALPPARRPPRLGHRGGPRHRPRRRRRSGAGWRARRAGGAHRGRNRSGRRRNPRRGRQRRAAGARRHRYRRGACRDRGPTARSTSW